MKANIEGVVLGERITKNGARFLTVAVGDQVLPVGLPPNNQLKVAKFDEVVLTVNLDVYNGRLSAWLA